MYFEIIRIQHGPLHPVPTAPPYSKSKKRKPQWKLKREFSLRKQARKKHGT